MHIYGGVCIPDVFSQTLEINGSTDNNNKSINEQLANVTEKLVRLY